MAQYVRNPPLSESELLPDPLAQLAQWIRDAEAANQVEPTAMTLATATPDGQPSARVVLFKGFHEGGLTFYTNYDSRKGQELARNPRVALVFWWDLLERSVRVEGRVARLPESLSRQYFYLRPRGSQLGALTSRQSQPVASRELLEQRLLENEQACADREVPFPGNWGGYRVEPESLEFWQGRADRLHDRLVYRRAGSTWSRQRLEP